MIATILSGILVSINWRYTFLVYGLGLVIFLFVLLFLPSAKLDRGENRPKRGTLTCVTPYFCLMFMTMVLFYTIPSNFATIVTKEQLIPASLIGVVMAVQNLVSFFTAMYLTHLIKKSGSYTKYLATGFLVLAFAALSVPNNVVFDILGVALLGIGLGIMVPVLNAQISLRIEGRHVPGAMALMRAMMFSGQFFSPILMNVLCSVFHIESIHGPFYLSLGLAFVS